MSKSTKKAKPEPDMAINSDKKTQSPATAGKKTPGGGAKYFAAYMRRDGPKAPGSKPIPIGKPKCFAGLKFLSTGVLESTERADFERIVKQYGGTCVSGVTKKLDYLVVGNDPGHAKIKTAEELKVRQLTEDQFLQLIVTRSGITGTPKYEGEEQLDAAVIAAMMEDENDENAPNNKNAATATPSSKLTKMQVESEDETPMRSETIKEHDDFIPKTPEKKKLHLGKESPSKQPAKKERSTPTKSQPKVEPAKPAVFLPSSSIKPEIKKEASVASSTDHKSGENELWVEKHKPKSISKIIGQAGDKSNAGKLLTWLKNWNKNHGSGAKAPAPKKQWGGFGGGANANDDGSSFKAALLSGSPGIGKTTTAQLVCKEAGFTYIELNASDSRSKKLLDSVLGESIENFSLDNYFKKPSETAAAANNSKHTDNHCVIMDEVDGMAGNEDRGGIQELINLIKQARIPIICICNDRQHVKIRSLANYCFDLRFGRPNVMQVRAALMGVCFRENVKVTPEVLDQIIVGANYDIRQCLNNLSMWSSNNKSLNNKERSSSDIERAMKDIKMNPFEALKQTFHVEPDKPRKSLADKMELFFTDYSLMPLLVHENYLQVKPAKLEGTTQKQKSLSHLELASQSIESICQGDRIGRLLRSSNNWSLLTPISIFASVVPGEKLAGELNRMTAFPSWFGKNSKQGRVDRILQELQKHMRIHISANKLGVGMDYLSVLKNMLTKPLIKKKQAGIQEVINLMNEYSITREDFDTICELATWPNQKDVTADIDTATKSAFTRQYNKEAHKNPFTLVDIKKLKGTKLSDDAAAGEEEGEEEEEVEDDDIKSDAMIKMKERKATTAAAKTSGTKRPAKDDADGAKAKKPKKK